MIKCKLCEKEIPEQMCQQGGLHMDCHDKLIDVWSLSLLDNRKHCYCDNDLNNIMCMLENAEEAYVIETVQMQAGQFFNLPEFEGF